MHPRRLSQCSIQRNMGGVDAARHFVILAESECTEESQAESSVVLAVDITVAVGIEARVEAFVTYGT